MMEGEGRRKAHENIIRPKAGINSIVAFKRYVRLTLGDGSTMKVEIAEGSTVEVATGATVVCVREEETDFVLDCADNVRVKL
jgi:hypothetical protein